MEKTKETRGERKRRRRAEMIQEYEEQKKRISEMGYEVFKSTSQTWTFRKDGKESVLGFDYEGEVVIFILKNEPNPEKIFAPYK